MPVIVESRIPDICRDAEIGATEAVAETTDLIADHARANLVAHGSVESGGLLDSLDASSDGMEGEVSAGDGLPDARAVYVELGTGVRGSGYEFPGKPDGITYDMSWVIGIPKDPAHGFAYLIPALELEREPFEARMGRLYR